MDCVTGTVLAALSFTMLKPLPKYFTDLTVGLGVCAAALSQHGVIVCDLRRSKEREFLEPFSAHLHELDVESNRLYDAAGPYGYAWVYYDPNRFSKTQALTEARESFPESNFT